MDDLGNRVHTAFFGMVNSVSHTLSNAASSVTEKVGSTVDHLTVYKPPPPPPPPSLMARAEHFAASHKRAVSAIGLGVAAAAVYALVWRPFGSQRWARRRTRHRMAARAADGGRNSVVVLCGSPSEPLIRLMAQDLNVRGFIVYILCSRAEQELVLREKCTDIRPLVVDTDDANDIARAARHLDEILRTPVASFASASPHRLSLAGIVVLPDLFYPTGPVEAIAPAVWAHTIQNKLITPLALLSGGFLDLTRHHQARLVLVTPAIISSLNPAFHAAEALCVNALDSLALSLARELEPQHIPLVHVKLGSFDTGYARSQERQIVNSMRADMLGWPEHMRHLYGNAYASSAHLQTNRTRGSRLRVLHHALFDALTAPSPRVVHVGRGSYAYQLLSALLPERLLTWILSGGSDGLEL